MPIAQCRLCLKHRNLLESHLIPRALYTLCRTSDSDPVLVTSELVMQTSRQTKDYLLCPDCEGLLNREGETWVLPRLATVEGVFPLYDSLRTANPLFSEEDFAVYSGANIPDMQVDKLANFALGVFWKASAHPWSAKRIEASIELGPYSEPLRTFLIGQSQFPKDMALLTTVLPAPVKLIMFNHPYEGVREKGGRKFLFYVPGIQFALFTGKSLEGFVRALCTVSNPTHPLFVSDMTDSVGRVAMKFYTSARKSRKYLDFIRNRK